MAAVLRDVDPSVLLTVGSAGSKWATAWTHLDIDFYQIHYYPWNHQWYPYNTWTPQFMGLTNKPVLIGEFPLGGIPATDTQPAVSAADLLAGFMQVGFAGALGWSYSDPTPSLPWLPQVLLSFSAQHSCETKY